MTVTFEEQPTLYRVKHCPDNLQWVTLGIFEKSEEAVQIAEKHSGSYIDCLCCAIVSSIHFKRSPKK